MTPEERQALALAEWLEAHPGTAPPKDVDADVLQAIYALRPELAPEPGVTADDILSLVTDGPLAGPAPQTLAAVPPVPAPANANRQAWLPWLVGGASAIAAAALALVVIGPSLVGGGPGDLNADVAVMQELAAPSAAEPPSEDPGTGNVFRKDQAGADGVPQLAARPEPDLDPPPPPAAPLAKAEAQTASGPAKEAPARERNFPLGGAVGASDGDAVADLELAEVAEEEAEDFFDNLPADDAAAPVEPAVTTSSTAAGRSTRQAPVAADEVAVESDLARDSELRSQPRTATRAGEESADRGLFGRRKNEEKKKDRKSDSSAPASEEVSDQGAGATDLAQLEREARPTRPVAAETEAVMNLLNAGQAADARDAAQRLLDQGGLSRARRADLSWALGKAHQALGDRTKAAAAYSEAIRLRS